MKTIFTTAEVAELCNVSQREVGRWHDTGRLRGYKVSGSFERRIPRAHLIRFFKEYAFTDALAKLEQM